MFIVEEYTSFDQTVLRYGKLINPEASNNKILLYIPGLGGSVKGALHFLEPLLPHYKAIYGPDLRNFGLNRSISVSHIQTILNDLLSFHQHVLASETNSEFDLAAISLGAVLATHLITRLKDQHGIDYQRFVAIAPAYKPHPDSFPPLYVFKTILRRIFQGKNTAVPLPYNIRAITQNPDVLSDPHYQNWPDFTVSVDFLLSIKALAHSALELTKTIHIPTMILVPGADLVCSPEGMHQAFENIPDPTQKMLKDYPGLYHDLPLEAACPQIAEDTRQWLSNPKS